MTWLSVEEEADVMETAGGGSPSGSMEPFRLSLALSLPLLDWDTVIQNCLPAGRPLLISLDLQTTENGLLAALPRLPTGHLNVLPSFGVDNPGLGSCQSPAADP